MRRPRGIGRGRVLDLDAAHRIFFLYIVSMRWVTRNPPKIFPQAKISAINPNTRAHIPPLPTTATPTASSAPTTITEEIALVTDISGVVKAGVAGPPVKQPTRTPTSA